MPKVRSPAIGKGLPPMPRFDPDVRRAPKRECDLSEAEMRLALRNALRYLPPDVQSKLAPEFLDELATRGRIYAYRYRPSGPIFGRPISEYQGIPEARALQVMIDNNLDFDVALYPYELVTYGETGQVCQNWLQYRLIRSCLEAMTEEQTLVVMSGHPLGLFPSHRNAPRVVSTNGLMVGMFDNPSDFQRAQALGVSNYGQMTAGGWMYIGPQGIVHGTYLTLLNAGRKYLGLGEEANLKGVTYLSSGLGGMSGAQAKAVEIAGGAGVIAEVDRSRIEERKHQGWLSRASEDLDQVTEWMVDAREKGRGISIGYYGNVVDLWQHVVDERIKIELASDQTSCHAAYEGGYTPAGVDFEEGRRLLRTDRTRFVKLVNASLKRQFKLIQTMKARGTRFWDYGNSFLKAVYDAGESDAAIGGDVRNGFVFPSYVEDIIGPICFDHGYGPFRWVCLSGRQEDLDLTDAAALDAVDEIWKGRKIRRGQDRDNYIWLRDAKKNNLVVGTKARILYADGKGRVAIARKFNQMVRSGVIGPVMLGRDHHDVSGTDSPFRETANVKDGSNVMAEMAHQCWAGNIARGMTLAVLSNGGGVGTGKAINGGFGLFLDGSERVDRIVSSAVDWDVACGIARRAWAGNPNAIDTAKEWNEENEGSIILPFEVKEKVLDRLPLKESQAKRPSNERVRGKGRR